MILGINCGRSSIKVEFKAGNSDLWMASRDASSKSRAMRVETEWRRKVKSTKAESRKISRLGRMLKRVEDEDGAGS